MKIFYLKDQAGDGHDVLIDIEKVRFSIVNSFIHEKGLITWDENAGRIQYMGSYGDDDFSNIATDNSKDYYFNGGMGDDLIIGAVEPGKKNESMGWW